MWFLPLQNDFFMSHIPMTPETVVILFNCFIFWRWNIENLKLSRIFADREKKAWETLVMLICTNISTLFKTFSLLDGNTPKHWIAMDSLPPLGLQFLSVQIKSNTSTSKVFMFAWLTIDHWLECRSKSLSSMDGWQILQLQPTQHRL